jgi:hypothetical protein
VRFYGGLDQTSGRKWTGAMTVVIGGDQTPAGLRVDFSFVVTGKPNLVIRAAGAARSPLSPARDSPAAGT